MRKIHTQLFILVALVALLLASALSAAGRPAYTTRVVTGTIRKASGAAWAEATITFKLDRSSYTSTDQFPADTITATTDSNGQFTQTLWCNAEGVVLTRYTVTLPDKSSFSFRLAAGSGSIDLAVLRASGSSTAPANSDTYAVLETLVEAHADAIASADDLGHIKVGSGLSIAEDGTLSAESQVNALDDLSDVTFSSPANDDLLQRKVGVWINRTPAQVKTDLALVKADVGLGSVDNTSDANKPVSTATQAALDSAVADLQNDINDKQNLDSDLTTIAGLTPANNDFLQRIAGAWANRTPAQVKTSLAIVSSDLSDFNPAVDARISYPVTTVFGRTGGVVPAANDYTWAQIDKTTSSLADITTRSASDLSSGTLPDGRFPATLPATSGVNLTALNASNLGSGAVPAARMPALTGDVTTSAGAVATSIGAGKVTNSMLAGLIDLTTKVTGILPTANGGTANAFFTVSGPATSAKTFTFPNANATIARTDAGQTFTGDQVVNGNITFTDNTYDIGASGATRPRRGYFGTSIFVGTNPATSGAVNIANNATVSGRNSANNGEYVLARVTTSNNIAYGNDLWQINTSTGALGAGGSYPIIWTVGSADTGIVRSAASVVRATNGTSGGGAFQTGASSGQPTCDSTSRGAMWTIYSGAGVADIFQVCMKGTADTYSWRTVFTAP